MKTNGSGSTHVDLKVFGCRVDLASGGVVLRQVVQRHMSYPHRVREGDGEGSLDTGKRPTFAWEQRRVTLGGEETQSGYIQLVKILTC